MWWAVTWKNTVEYVSCKKAPKETSPRTENAWIVNKHGVFGGTYMYPGIQLFETEVEACTKLVSILEGHKSKLQAWIDVVAARVEELKK